MTYPSAPAGARREREERVRRRRAIVAAVVVVAVLALCTAYALAKVGNEQNPNKAAPASDSKAANNDVTPAVGECPTLTPEMPLDLWIGGDSLAGSLGPSLGELTAETGVVQPQFDSRVSSGLTSPEFFDWPEHATEQLATLMPDTVAFVIGTNDANNAPAPDSESGAEWLTQYEALTDEMMAILIGPGRTVYWVGAPIMESNDLSEQVRLVNEVAQRVAERHPEVTYVDAYSRFSSPEGQYIDAVLMGDGDTVSVRAGDGVHFTPEGGDYLAEPVFSLLDEENCISDQASPDEAKDVLETQGSTRVPGTSHDVSTPATTATTAPTATTTTTAAPVTSTVPPSTSTSSTTTTTTTTTSSPQGGGL